MSTEAAIAKLGPAADKAAFALEKAMIAGGMQFALEKAHFIANLWHESGFVPKRENMNYSAEGLLDTFNKYFKSESLANQYARQPKKIANFVYANRMGNGNAASNDGWNYRGGGDIQLTGKNNYTRASLDIFGDDRLVKNSELIIDPFTSAACAVWFWNTNGCGFPAMRDDARAVRKKINGGYNGMDDVQEKLVAAKQAFGIF